MTEERDCRAQAAIAALSLYSPKVRERLLSRRAFRDENHLDIDPTIVLMGVDARFSRRTLFIAIREAFRLEQRQRAQDMAGRLWEVSSDDASSSVVIRLPGTNSELRIAEYASLANEVGQRLEGFRQIRKEVHLPERHAEPWSTRLVEGPLSDEDAAKLNEDINNTPERTYARIVGDLAQGTASLAGLVPDNATYYERLLGELPGGTLIDFIEGPLPHHIQSLLAWDAERGLKSALLLSAQPSIPTAINVAGISVEILKRVFEWLASRGDCISQTGAVELGIRQLQTGAPALEEALARLSASFSSDLEKGAASRVSLLAALFTATDGELSRNKALERLPPWARRLAALAQASLIERAAVEVRVDFGAMSEQLKEARVRHFYLQTLCDIRTEPRWMPESGSVSQWRAELIGRIVSAARARPAALNTQLHEAILGEGDGSLVSQLTIPEAFLPGPLEGTIAAQQELPEELRLDCERKLNEKPLSAKSFISLINTSLFFKTSLVHAELAAQGLQLATYHLDSDDSDELLAICRGLAHVASVTRSMKLAQGVNLLVRRARAQKRLRDFDAFTIVTLAAGAQSDREKWCEALGHQIEVIAQSCEDEQEAELILTNLVVMCQIEPLMWATAGRAEAALRAFIGQ